MEWNENGMEWKETFGMEYGRCSEWNEKFEKYKEWKIVFHTSILTTYRPTVYIKTYIKLRSTTKLESAVM